jgi:hypothetical protein
MLAGDDVDGGVSTAEGDEECGVGEARVEWALNLRKGGTIPMGLSAVAVRRSGVEVCWPLFMWWKLKTTLSQTVPGDR